MIKPLWNPNQLTCEITIGNWPPCEGVQKLIGFSRGLGFHKVDYFPYWHHSNSIRLGYNRDSWESPIRLFMYAYVDGRLIEPNECVLGEFEVGAEINTLLRWRDEMNAYICLYDTNGLLLGSHSVDVVKTLPIGFLLNPYAEIDGKENKQIPFEVDIKDLKVNGELIKIK